MSRRPGHGKFNVTGEVISKGFDGKKHFCNGGTGEGGLGGVLMRTDNRN